MTDSRYMATCRRIRAGEPVHPSDYKFYRRYCKAHGLIALPAERDSSVPSVECSEKVSRYDTLVAALKEGKAVSQADYAFLRRYCKGSELPRCRAVYVLVED